MDFSDDDKPKPKKAAVKKKLGPSTITSKKSAASKPKTVKKSTVWSDESENEKPKKSKKKKFSDSGSDFALNDSPVQHRNTGGRVRKTVQYNFGDSDED